MPPMIVKLLKDLSQENLILLKYIFTFLNRVSSFSASNRMKPHQLALVFTSILTDTGTSENIMIDFVELLINHPEWIPKKQRAFLRLDFGEKPVNNPKLLFSETILYFYNDTMNIIAENQISGVTFITNFQIIFVYFMDADSQKQFEISFPLCSILTVEKRGKDKETSHLYIQSKDFKCMSLFFSSLQDLTQAQEHLSRFGAPQPLNTLFAFNFGLFYEKETGFRYRSPDYSQEYRRQGVQTPSEWRYFSSTQAKSYPKQVLIPATVLETLIQKIGSLYSGFCFPTIVWQNTSKLFLLRSGIFYKESFGLTSSKDLKSSNVPSSPRLNDGNKISLPRSNSIILEKENPNRKAYLDSIIANSEFRNLNVVACLQPNELKKSSQQNRSLLTFHDVEESYLSLREGIFNGVGSMKFTNAVKTWVSNIGEMILSSHSLSGIIEKGDHLLIEDNGTGNFRLISLILLQNDPFYRTITGFFVLIEHVWIRFGYSFAEFVSVGRSSSSNTKIGAFVQFIDAVWQIWSQCPTHFEFNEEFLITILEGLFSGCYGTFLVNNEREQEIYNDKTVSVWEMIMTEELKFRNPFYNQSTTILNFDPGNKKIVFWADYYLQWANRDAYYGCCKAIEENISSKDRHLNLTHRKVTSLPNIIEGCIYLTSLTISHCRLTTFPIIVALLTSLQSIDFSYNSIRYISEPIIEKLKKLEYLNHLDLSYNDIYTIDSSITTLTSLRNIDIGNTKFPLVQIPENFFHFEELTSLCMDGYSINYNFNIMKNSLKSLSLCKTGITGFGKITFPVLETLIFRENNISSLKDFGEFPSITHLDLGSNSFVEIPEEIFAMTTLKKLYFPQNNIDILSPKLLLLPLEILDIQQNNFTVLPPFFSKFQTLQSLLFTSDALLIPPKDIAKKEFEVVRKYLQDRISHKVKTYRIRLMFVGQENVGKSSLMRALKSKNFDKKNISTDGIHIDDWKIPIEMANGTQVVTATVYDFAGQDVYYSSHQLFLCSESIYLLIWNILDRVEDSKIDYWLESVKASSTSPVLLVATHIDNDRCTKDFLSRELANVAQKYARKFPTIKKITAVSCHSGKGVNELSTILHDEIKKQPFLGKEYPIKFEYLENYLLSLRKKVIPPIISKAKFLDICQMFCIEEEEVTSAARALHTWGTIFYHSDVILQDLIILDPSWLTKLMATILTTKHSYVRNGVVLHRDLIHIWHPSEYPLEFHQSLHQLLENFEIIFPLKESEDLSWEERKSLVPVLLSAQKPEMINELFPRFDQSPQYSRIFQFNFVPSGFVNHLFIRIMQFSHLEICWRNGALAYDNIKNNQKNIILIELIPSTNEMHLIVRGMNAAKSFLQCVNIIESFIESWYKLEVNIVIPCPHCTKNRLLNPTFFSFATCKEAAMKGSPYVLCNSGNSVRLDVITPDLSMAEVQRIEYSHLIIEKEIGKGGFATVYKATYNDEIVALKVIDLLDPSMLEAAYSDFVKESSIMSGLQHQNIIGFRGLCMNPLCIVTEFANNGNLYDFLHSENTKELASSMALKLKIAYDIANGMKFLHNRTPPVIHADLKSPNILLYNLDTSATTVAVVADFGLSKVWVPVLQGRNVDNPVWLAPEILSGKEYSEKADVYSFGVILYEILTLNQFFGEYTFMSVMEDDIIAGKRPQDLPEDDEFGLVELVKDSWQNDPIRRPPFTEIVSRLLTIIKKSSFHSSINISNGEIRSKNSNFLQNHRSITEQANIQYEEGPVELSSRIINSLYPKHDFGVTSLIVANNNEDLWTTTINGSISVYNIYDNYIKEKVIPAHSNHTISAITSVGDFIWTAAVDERVIKVWRQIDTKLVKIIPTNSIDIISFININNISNNNINEVWAGSISGNIYTWQSSGEEGSFIFNEKNLSLSSPLQSILEKLRDPIQGIEIHTKSFGNKLVTKCFKSSDLITWIISNGDAVDRLQGLQFVKGLVKAGIIYHVLQSSLIEDNDSLFRITSLQSNDIKYIKSNQDSQPIGFYFIASDMKNRDIVNISCMYYDKETNLLWIGHNNGIVIFDIAHNTVNVKSIDHKMQVNNLISVNQTVWSSSMDKTIRVFSKKSMEVLKVIDGHSAGIFSLLLYENTIWSASSDRTISIWNANDYSMINEYKNQHSDSITSLILVKCNEKMNILTASLDKSVLVWNPDDDVTLNDENNNNIIINSSDPGSPISKKNSNNDNNNNINLFIGKKNSGNNNGLDTNHHLIGKRNSNVNNNINDKIIEINAIKVHPDVSTAIKTFKSELNPNLVMMTVDSQLQQLNLNFACKVNAIQLALQFPTDEPRFALFAIDSDISKKFECTGLFFNEIITLLLLLLLLFILIILLFSIILF